MTRGRPKAEGCEGDAGISEGNVQPPMSPLPQGGRDAAPAIKKNMKRRRLTRKVSQDELAMVMSCEAPNERGSEGCCHLPHLTYPNPLEIPSMRQVHVAAIRLEVELHPMRLIIARLMSHPAHNRKGIFNHPVDPLALGLPDYLSIVPRPMDLGTIKRRLHAIAYKSRQEVAEDIRLVFQNSMRYNPPMNPVHKAAKELLVLFELWYQKVESREGKTPSINSLHTNCQQYTASLVEAHQGLVTSAPALDSSSQTDASLPPASKIHVQPPTAVDGASVVLRTTSANQLVDKNPTKKPRLPPFLPHSCGTCKGRICQLCQQGCLFHEPVLLVCQGVHCGGAKVRKGSIYYVSSDGNHHYCIRCYTNLTPVLPGTSEGDPCRYKQDLLKRKNDEEIAEKWLNCSKCGNGVHAICMMHNGYTDDSDFICFDCEDKTGPLPSSLPRSVTASDDEKRFTFICGSDTPIPLSALGINSQNALSAESLPKCSMSSFIEAKVASQMQCIPNADKTITVRVISDCSRSFMVPDVVRRHFRMATESNELVKPPSQVRYRQKAITLFQKIDGLDVCIFCMYVQEYDGDDDYDTDIRDVVKSSHKKRVYIAYIDSVEHFRPRKCRTEVYHEMLVSYLATARLRGYETAHIWACPPSRGNNFVFWNHPSSQRTPNRERLLNWYHGALARGIGCGVITDVKSLFESEFEKNLREVGVDSIGGGASRQEGRMLCPPLLDGDFWIEEAVRVRSAHLSRHIKVRAPTEVCVWNVTPLALEDLDPCPAMQLATLIKDRVMTHPSSVPFRRPVNAAAMKLQNYHLIVKKPIDLGTIYAQCMIGEYHQLCEIVDDVILMVANAKKFNPTGHYVHIKADEVLTIFFQELAALVKIWDVVTKKCDESASWEAYADMSMNLDKSMSMSQSQRSTDVKQTSVIIEDDRSSDGSRSMNSSIVSMPSSPLSVGLISRECDQSSDGLPVEAAPPSKLARTSSRGRGKGRGRRISVNKQPISPPRKLNLLSDGPEAVMQKMVGNDLWLLDKKNANSKSAGFMQGAKRRRSSSAGYAEVENIEDPALKRRRQSWVGEEVSHAVRRFRTAFFTCSLVPIENMTESERIKLDCFKAYSETSVPYHQVCEKSISSPISNARHALLEFSQYRHFEFDTLRRAKFSTSMLLFHLMSTDAPGVVPICASCDNVIEEVRWHKVKKATEKRRITKFMKPIPSESAFVEEELCCQCYAKSSRKDEFIPIQVSLKLS